MKLFVIYLEGGIILNRINYILYYFVRVVFFVEWYICFLSGFVLMIGDRNFLKKNLKFLLLDKLINIYY